MPIDLFISHSSKDHDIAEALIALLQTACSIPPDRIRCSSVDGYRLPGGVSTDEQLRLEVRDSRAFIGLITPCSIEATYVLFELGARWGAELNFTPLLAGGADSKTLRGPLSGINALDCTSVPQIHQLISELSTTLGYTPSGAAVYQKYADRLVTVAKLAVSP